ncbi:MAG: S8 family serine peptidase, partial [Armatimonadaceae bacterium]
NPDEPVDGKDNDGNGYVDDNLGWDFHNDDRTPFDDPRNVHGTHVSGTIGAVGGNGIGVVGVCWKVSVIPCKFLGSSGGTMANAVKAMDYLTDLKLRHGLNIVASNHSYGSVGFSVPLFYAVQRAAAADILVVAAAGNGGVDKRGDNVERTPFYPGSYPLDNVITVAGIGTSGTLMSISNYSPNWVHLGAPGQNILSTVPTAK